MGRFIIKKLDEGIQFFLAAGNREVIAASAMYNSKASCMKGISSVVRNAPVASVEDKTCRKSEKERILYNRYVVVEPAGRFSHF